MEIYRKPTTEEAKLLKKHAKALESIRISEPAEYAGNIYREVVFENKVVAKNTYYLYLDSANNVITDKTTILRLGRIFFFMDAYLNDGAGSIIGALQNDDAAQKDKDDLQLMVTGLKILDKRRDKYDVPSKDIQEVQKILTKVMELRSKTNEKLNIFLKSVENAMKNKKYFHEDVIEECMPAYKEVMICNYEKVKLISKGSSMYNGIKKAAEKSKKSYSIRFNMAQTEALHKVSYMMGYFENLLRSYNTILNMSVNQYIKGISSAGKTNAEYKLEQIRK